MQEFFGGGVRLARSLHWLSDASFAIGYTHHDYDNILDSMFSFCHDIQDVPVLHYNHSIHTSPFVVANLDL